MIVDDQGRSRSVLTDDEIIRSIQADLSNLTPQETDTLVAALAELSGRSDVKILDLIAQAEYCRTIIPPEQWVDDPYFVGSETKLYPKLREDFIEIFMGDYQECIFGGAIGWGKSYLASICLMRIIYELSCLQDPQKGFGLDPSTALVIPVISVTLDTAQEVLFELMLSKLPAIRFFTEEFPFREHKGIINFPNGIMIKPAAANDTSVLGRATYTVVMDETNFFKVTNAKQGAAHQRWGTSQAAKLYGTIVRRMRSRFMQVGGRVAGKLFILSSKGSSDSFTEQRIKEARFDPHVFVREYARYDLKPENFTGKRFWVLVGNELVSSRILGPNDNPKDFASIEGTKLIQIPEEERQQFEIDLEGSIREIAGLATVSISPFIQRREMITKMFEGWPMTHPFNCEQWDPESRGFFIFEKLVETGMNGETAPRCCPRAPRHIHIDGSSRVDSTGFCMTHIGGSMKVQRKNKQTEEIFEESAPIFHVDVVLRINPPVGGEIILGDVRRLIYELTEKGFHIPRVSMDSWQSLDSRQILQQKGYAADELSVDTSMAPYETLKVALYEGRVKGYYYAPLLEELQRLEYNAARKKVDHPKDGSKDVSDALAATVFSLATREGFSHSEDFRVGAGMSRGLVQYPDGSSSESHGSRRQEDFPILQEPVAPDLFAPMDNGAIMPILPEDEFGPGDPRNYATVQGRRKLMQQGKVKPGDPTPFVF